MARFKFASFLLAVATLLLVVSAEAQLGGLLGNLLGTVTGVVATTVSSLVKIVDNLLFDSHRIIIVMDKGTKP
ncbi:hypothetical protein L915_12735, partial [Phytophthora nicotianae]